MSLNELIHRLFGEESCNCPSCRVERGEGEWVDVREMTPNEIDEWRSIRAERDAIAAEGKRLMNRMKAVEARKTLFWLKADPKDEHEWLKADVKIGKFRKAVLYG